MTTLRESQPYTEPKETVGCGKRSSSTRVTAMASSENSALLHVSRWMCCSLGSGRTSGDRAAAAFADSAIADFHSVTASLGSALRGTGTRGGC